MRLQYFRGYQYDAPKSIVIGSSQEITESQINEEFEYFQRSNKTLRFHLTPVSISLRNQNLEQLQESLLINLRKFTSLQAIQIIISDGSNQPYLKVLIDCLTQACSQITEFRVIINPFKATKAIVDITFEKVYLFPHLQTVKIELQQFAPTVPKIIGQHLSKSQSLRCIEYAAGETPQSSSVQLFDELSKIKTIDTFYLNYNHNPMTGEGSRALGEMISSLPNLKDVQINMAYTKIMQEPTEMIGKALSACNNLQNLKVNFSHNKITAGYLHQFAEELGKINKLKSCELQLNCLTYDKKTVDLLISAFSNMKNLTKLLFHDLQQGYFWRGYGMTEKLEFDMPNFSSRVLRNLPNLTHLDLQVRNTSVIPILNDLKYCEFLEYLAVSEDFTVTEKNNYSEKKLKQALQNLENIPRLKLYFPTIGSNSIVKIFASTLKNLQSTNDLCLEFNLHNYYIENQQEQCQQILFLDELMHLKNTLNHLQLVIKKTHLTKNYLHSFLQYRDLYSLKIYSDHYQPQNKMELNFIYKMLRLVHFEIK